MLEELVVRNNPKSSFSEAIKGVRTNLKFASVDKEIKTILITSSMPGEGKSFISANLAVAFAEAGSKTLLVDCDLRRGRQHKIFGVQGHSGYSNLLISNATKGYSKYLKKTDITGLTLLPMGTVPPNPIELLDSKKNKAFIEMIKEEYDVIIFDCPPVNAVIDALTLTDIMDTILIVCSMNVTPKPLLDSTKKRIEQVNGKLGGVIINNASSKGKGYYNSYYNSYYE